MSHKRSSTVMLALFLWNINTLLAATPQTTASEIKKSLVCSCDCSMTVEVCEGSMACETAEKLALEAQQLADRGWEHKAVLSAFVDKYGERILAAPTKTGFNLTAWLLPFAVIFLSGFGIVVALRRWVGRQQSVPINTEQPSNSGPDEKSPYEEQLDQALRLID